MPLSRYPPRLRPSRMGCSYLVSLCRNILIRMDNKEPYLLEEKLTLEKLKDKLLGILIIVPLSIALLYSTLSID